jgi:branched-chain amino acid aminotransferase
MRQSVAKPPQPLAYFNGRWLPLSQVGVSVFDTGFVQGVTVAEQLRTFGGKVFRLDRHLARLARSLEIIGVAIEPPLGEIAQIAEELAAQNAKLLDPADDQQVTIFVTPGIGPTYQSLAAQTGPTVCIHTQPLAFAQWAKKYELGDALVVTDIRQVPEACWPPELKCRSRMHYYLADKQAREREPGARALLLDERGLVLEASTANVLIYEAQRGLLSPPKEHILPGITVAVLEDLARQVGIPFLHDELTVERVAKADEILLCSTSPCVWSVTRLNGRLIADGKPGPISRQLRGAWSEMVGFDIENQARRFAVRAH